MKIGNLRLPQYGMKRADGDDAKSSVVRDRQLSVTSVSGVQVTIHSTAGKAGVSGYRRLLLNWVANKAGADLPRRAYTGGNFAMDRPGAPRIEAASIADPDYWALRVDIPDKGVAGRVWSTEIGLCRQDEENLLLQVRLHVSTVGPRVPFNRSIPAFIGSFARKSTVRLDGRPVTGRPVMVATDREFEEFVDLLEALDRQAPMIVLTLMSDDPDLKRLPVDAAVLAAELTGAAHVHVLTRSSAMRLVERAGTVMAVFNGAVRTYVPDYLGEDDEPLRHPLTAMRTISSWNEGDPDTTYIAFLKNKTLAYTARWFERRGADNYAKVRAMSGAQSLETARENAATDEELHALALKEVESLTRQRDEKAARLEVVEEELAIAEAASLQLRHRLDILERRAGSDDREDHDAVPADLKGFKAWCDDHLTGKVVVTTQALRAARDSRFEDVALIYRSLLLLRDHYVPMKRGDTEGARARFEEALGETGLKIGQSMGKTGYGEQGKTYKVVFGGAERTMNLHLKKGRARDERHCFRLYFFWDSESEQVVVGSLPAHLRTRIS